MLIIVTKIILYFMMAALALACIQTANSMKEKVCDCKVINLISIIIGTFTFTCAIYYDFSDEYDRLAIMPLIFGFTLNLLMNNPEMHFRVNQLLAFIRSKFHREAQEPLENDC